MNCPSFLRKSLIIGLIILSFAGLGLRISLDSYFYQNSPREPIPAEGKIYPENVYHGTHVYLTRTEDMVFDLLPFALVFFIVAAFLNMRWKWLGPHK